MRKHFAATLHPSGFHADGCSSALLALLVAVLLNATNPLEAAVLNANTGSLTDVQSAVNSAVSGDTIAVPAGTATWTNKLTISKAVSLVGAGIGQTIIIDEVPRNQGASRLIDISTAATGTYRISGLTLRPGTVNNSINYDGDIFITGITTNLRIDHCSFERLHSCGIGTRGAVQGVVDHCFFDLNGTQGLQIWHDAWAGRSFGDGSWSDDAYWGTARALYIEDNVFVSQTGTQGVVDNMAGGRCVFRYNSVTNVYIASHGVGGSDRFRSMRTYEIYNNYFQYTNGIFFTAVYIRGGSGLVWSNKFANYDNGVLCANYRSPGVEAPWPAWGVANGTATYDGNTDGNGYPCLDQCGRGKGDVLSNYNSPVPQGWPHQAVEPIYEWGNILSGRGSNRKINSQQVVIAANRDWFGDTPKPGYTPFAYPHPLVSGVRPGLSAPVGLRFVAGP